MSRRKQTYSMNFKKFHMSQIPDDSVVLLLGKRNTGKSWVVKDILYTKKNIPFGVAISPTDEMNPFFAKFMPKGLIAGEYEPSIVDRVLNRQGKIKNMRDNGGPEASKLDTRGFLVLDDCLADAKKWKNSSQINTVVLNGRHYDLLFLLTLQYPRGVGPTIRTNADFIIINKGYCGKNLKIVYEDFVGCFDNFSTFKQVYQSLGPYECLVLDNLSQSSKLEDKVFWYKAQAREKFRCCSDAYWKSKTTISSAQTRSLDNYGEYNNKIKLKINKLN